MEKKLYLETKFLEKEDIVSKIQFVQELELISHYQAASSNRSSERYWDKVKRVLEEIPEQYHTAALALFANILYFPKNLLDDALSFLYHELQKYYELPEAEILKYCWIAEFEQEGILTNFFRINNIEGRKDEERGIDDPGALIDKLLFLIRNPKDARLKDDIVTLLSKKYWIILIDLSLSGTSLSGELSKLLEIKKLIKDIFPIVPKIVVCSQIISSIALENIKNRLGKDDFDQIDFKYAIKFDNRFSIVSPECQLFNDIKTQDAVIEFCNWLDKQTQNDEELKSTRALCEDGDLSFGFKRCGWTIVTYTNTPNDSVLPIWYATKKKDGLFQTFIYSGLFPYVKSRIKQKTSPDKNNLRQLLSKKKKLLEILKESSNVG